MAMSGLPMRSWKSWERLPGSPEKIEEESRRQSGTVGKDEH